MLLAVGRFIVDKASVGDDMRINEAKLNAGILEDAFPVRIMRERCECEVFLKRSSWSIGCWSIIQ